MQPRLLDGRNLEVILSNVPLPEPDISVPFLSEVRKVPQGDYYRADKVLPLLKQWPVLYEAAKAGHEQAFAEAQNAAAVSAAKDAEIAGLRAELLKSLADNAALRERVKLLEAALRHVDDCLSINDYGDYVLLSRFDSDIVSAALEQKP